MFGSPISWYIIAHTLFDLLVKTHLTVHDSSHGKNLEIVGNNSDTGVYVLGFINHEKYLVDDMGSYHEVSNVDTKNSNVYNTFLIVACRVFQWELGKLMARNSFSLNEENTF